MPFDKIPYRPKLLCELTRRTQYQRLQTPAYIYTSCRDHEGPRFSQKSEQCRRRPFRSCRRESPVDWWNGPAQNLNGSQTLGRQPEIRKTLIVHNDRSSPSGAPTIISFHPRSERLHVKGNAAPQPQETELNEFDSHSLNSDAHTRKFAPGWKKPLLSSRDNH